MYKRQNLSFTELRYEQWTVGCTVTLLLFGLLMVASASMVISDRQFGYPFHYLMRQGIDISLGVLLAYVATYIPTIFWQKISVPLFFLGLCLMVIVLIPNIGHMVNGSRRWLQAGFFSFQVSEAMKFAALIYLAGYLQRHSEQVQTHIVGFVKPLLFLSLITLLLLLEPDFGAVVVLSILFFTLLFIAGVRWWWFVLLLLLVALILGGIAMISPYRLVRLTTFLNPWGSPYGSGYQLTQSLIAFGQGGLWGVGLGNSIQKLFYLPEAHTDFLFAVIAEEFGLIGALCLLGVFFILIVNIFRIGRHAQQTGALFSAYVTYGTAVWLGAQGLINMGVNTGILPTKGLTFPFISFGGSSMLVNCLVVGIVLRISRETRWRMI